MRTTVLAACALAAAALAAPTAEAASGGQKASKQRVDVDSVAGDYIQPEPVWVPVQREGRGGRPIFLGMTVRMHPGSEHRFEACVLAPHVNDWIVVDFNRAPPTRKDYDDATKIRARITDLVNAKAGRGVFRQIEVLHNHQAVDESSAALTEMCK